MTIIEANKMLEKIDNDLEYWLNKKAIILEDTIYPSSPDLSNVRVEGGKRTDKYKHLDYAIDEIDPEIDRLYKEKRILEEYIEKELIRLGKYNEVEQKIYELRNDYEYIKNHRGKKRTWWEIANMINYSERQCYRIYKKITGKRNDE